MAGGGCVAIGAEEPFRAAGVLLHPLRPMIRVIGNGIVGVPVGKIRLQVEAFTAGAVVGDQASQWSGKLLEIPEALEQPCTLVCLGYVHPPLFVHDALYNDRWVVPVALHFCVESIHSS